MQGIFLKSEHQEHQEHYFKNNNLQIAKNELLRNIRNIICEHYKCVVNNYTLCCAAMLLRELVSICVVLNYKSPKSELYQRNPFVYKHTTTSRHVWLCGAKLLRELASGVVVYNYIFLCAAENAECCGTRSCLENWHRKMQLKTTKLKTQKKPRAVKLWAVSQIEISTMVNNAIAAAFAM